MLSHCLLCIDAFVRRKLLVRVYLDVALCDFLEYVSSVWFSNVKVI